MSKSERPSAASPERGSWKWNNGLGLRIGSGGKGAWYKQTWTGGKGGKAVRVKIGDWPQMSETTARAICDGDNLELYLATIPESAWGKAHKARLRRHKVPRSKLETVDLLEKLPPAARRSYWTSLKLFGKWCKQWDFLDPTEGVIPPKSTKARERVLSTNELKKIWQVTDNPGFGHYVRVLILSAQRRSEVVNFSWEHVENGVWTNTGKGGKVNLVPIKTFEKYLGPEWRPTTSYSKAKAKLDRLSGVKGWTLHDLRRTAASKMGELEIDPFVIERVLGHSLKGVEGVYNRWKYVPQKAKAMETWASWIKSTLEPQI